MLEAPRDVVHNEIFNVGSQRAELPGPRRSPRSSATTFPGCEVTFGDAGGDNRSYRVSFDKITNKLPGFKCDWNASKGAAAAARGVRRSIDLDEETFTGRGHTRLKQLQHLIETGQLDDESLLEARHDHHAQTPIEGVAIIDLEQRSDDRGFFARTLLPRGVRRRRPRAARRAVQPVVQPQGRHAARHALPGRARTRRPSWSAASRGAIVDIIVDMRPGLADPPAARRASS